MNSTWTELFQGSPRLKILVVPTGVRSRSDQQLERDVPFDSMLKNWSKLTVEVRVVVVRVSPYDCWRREQHHSSTHDKL